MIFHGLSDQSGWTMVEYGSTWKYGYDFMLDAAQVIIDTDFRDKLQRVAITRRIGDRDADVTGLIAAAGNVLRDCPAMAQECAVLSVAGISQTMECPVQFVFCNQTNLVRLFSPIRKYFDEYGERVFDNYMNSVEIKAYCKDTERRTLQSMEQN